MSPSHIPTPLPSPATPPPSSSALRTQAQSANPMSIRSILGNDPPETPPSSRNTSLGDIHAAQAPQVPPPNLMTPDSNPVLPATDAETLTAGALLYSMRTRSNADDDREVVCKSSNPAQHDSTTAAGSGKGKGKDPELYDIAPRDNGDTSNRHVDRSAMYDVAESLLQLRYIENEIDSVSALLAFGAKSYECKDCRGDTGMLCPDCSKIPWRQRAVSPPSPVAKDEPDHHLYPSESDDEGPPSSTARKVAFDTSCHGNHVQHSAHEGNAVFDLLRLSSRRNRRSRRRTRRPEHHNGETRCRRCQAVQESVNTHYVERYRTLGCEGFEREDTQPLDDDAADDPQHGRYGAAVYDGDRNGAGAMSSEIPKLSRKTLERLEVEKWAWRSDPDPLVVPSSDDPMPLADAGDPLRLPLYAEESTVRASLHTSAVTEQTPHHPPPPPPPSSSSYTDPRSGTTYHIASAPLDPPKPIPSPPPSTRQTGQHPPITPSPLKHVQNAHSSPPPHPTVPAPRRFPHRPDLTNEFVHVGLPLKSRHKRPAVTAPATPPTDRKRKAAEVEVEGTSRGKLRRGRGKALVGGGGGGEGVGAGDRDEGAAGLDVKEGGSEGRTRAKGKAKAKSARLR